jgi:RHH-type proline utilization regulon transcriptional repressor/proline dehydrogenase/delta 1-pyrroline-5-carboxylate dehydrogenase
MPVAAALVEGKADKIVATGQFLAERPGPIISLHAAPLGRMGCHPVDLLLEEVSISINTTAAGGNASLMMIG